MAFFPVTRSASIVLIAVLAAAAAFLPAIVNSTIVVSPASAQQPQGMPQQNRDLPGRFVASGTVAGIQNERGEPSWVASGTWRMIVEQAADASVRSASFRSTFNMVHLDGTVPHKHTISDFKLASWAADNSTMTFDGTFTMTLAGEPRREVPVQIIIRNGNAVSIEIDSSVTTHFGDTPIYGIVTRMRGGMMMDDHIHGTTPRAAGSMQLAGLSRSTVNYYGNASGYLVQPEKGGNLPAVVMIHEWWGLNQNIKNMAETLAKEGYVVLAVDLYGKGQFATDAARARQLVAAANSNPGTTIENMKAAVRYLSQLENVDASRISSLGWCFGGGQSLQLALNSTDRPLAATIMYYGTPVTDKERLAAIKWPVLGIFGDRDNSIPVETVRQFEAALDANRIENDIHVYRGVGHAFANPSGDNYAPKEADDAWKKTLAFLKEHA